MKHRSVVSCILSVAIVAAPYGVPGFVSTARADDIVRCESKGNRYTECPINSHGYVRLSRELSMSDCTQGRTWDYDKRRIWVDDGCRAEFIVEDREGSGGGKGAAAAIVVLGALALAAAAASKDKKDRDRDHYDDGGYYGGGHTSYISPWMVGTFDGYNTDRGVQVRLTIAQDGRATADVGGQTLRGYVNDDRLYVGDSQFYLERAGDGFNTRDVGDNRSVVHFARAY